MKSNLSTSILYDARGRVFSARALCEDGRVRAVKVRGARAQYSSSVTGRLLVSPAGVVLFVRGERE